MERRTPQQLVRIDHVCPNCNIGNLHATGEREKHILYAHVCDTCEHRELIQDKSYPRYAYEDAN